MEHLVDLDIKLFLFLNNLGTEQWDGFWLFITNKYSAIPLYLLLVYFTYRTIGLKKTIFSVLLIALLITISDQTSNLFKYGFERLRPCHDDSLNDLFRLVKERCGGKFSYFSAHASNSMAVAVFFSLLLKNQYKYLPYVLLFWASLVGYSRIYIGVHFPLDVITGMFVGALYAWLMYKIATKSFLKG